jgi:uncharacterized protein YjbJ (UPF0337 family)
LGVVCLDPYAECLAAAQVIFSKPTQNSFLTVFFSNLSNSDQTASGLLAIMVNHGKFRTDKGRSRRNSNYHHLTRKENRMNADQLKGKWMQFKGELKQQYGKFTDDDLQQIEGNYDKFVGKVQERYGDKKDELMTWADKWHQKSAPEATKQKTR